MNYKDKKLPKYFGYKSRLLIRFIPIFLLLILSVCELLYINSYLNDNSIKYKENSSINYNVVLKEKSKTDNKIYLVNLIDYIATNFSYNNQFSKVVDYNLNYSVYGNVDYYDKNNNLIHTTNYSFIEPTHIKGFSNKIDISTEEQKIYYKSYVEDMNNIYPDANAIMTICLDTVLKVNDGQFKSSDIKSTSTITLPIKKDGSIEINKNFVDKESKIYKDVNVDKRMIIITLITLIVLLIALILNVLYMLKTLVVKKTKYQKYLEKIMDEYEEIIVESRNTNFKNIIML